MNPYNKESVFVFGLVAPVLFVVVGLGMGLHFLGKAGEHLRGATEPPPDL